ncbi:ER-derived vesicles protein Erv29p [[Candida] anglica]|uniref:ER-derived vesicles protein Erv29p n=1 Tax=[Candida] anglica TaxID=148631 RepID=A0ABP0EAT8_9ASCO
MSYRGPNQFNNQFRGGQPNSPPTNIGPVSSSKTPLEKFEGISKGVEDLIDEYSRPLKPYVPAIGRAFIVATFYEDSLRIISQWSEQVYYLHNYKHIYHWLTVLFLFLNIIVMSIASTFLILRKKNEIATSALVIVVIFQGLFYGLIFDGQFILRNLSVVGGLILAFSDSLVRDKRSLSMPGLPMLNNQDNKKYFLLTGRILLVILFLGFVFSASWSFLRLTVILVGFISCGSIIVGYKTKFAAFILTVLLFTYNVFANQFWKYGAKDSSRDFLKYEFFQTLSIVGGLLIIVNAGAGELSLDEKKKIY